VSVIASRGRRRRSRGQGLAEFALVFPVLILILMGIFDLGRAVFAFNALGNAAREGTRVGIVNQYLPDIRARVLTFAPTIDQNDPPTRITISSVACGAQLALGCDVTVQIDTTFTLITPIVSNIVGPITMHVASSQPVEFECGVATAPITNPANCPKQP